MEAEKGRRAYGDEAEEVCAARLAERGYQILARNFQCRSGELDIVAKKDDVVCVVEVRMRSTSLWGDPALTVSWAKQRRIVKTTLYYLNAARLAGAQVRFDVMSVVGRGPNARVEHIENAFDAGM